MAKQMTREQEKAMFAKGNEGKSYKGRHTESTTRPGDRIVITERDGIYGYQHVVDGEIIQERSGFANEDEALTASYKDRTKKTSDTSKSIAPVNSTDRPSSEYPPIGTELQFTEKGLIATGIEEEYRDEYRKKRWIVIGYEEPIKCVQLRTKYSKRDAPSRGINISKIGDDGWMRETGTVERLNSPPLKSRPTKVTGEAKFKDGRLVTPKSTLTETHTRTIKTKRERSTKKQRVTIEPTGKGDTKEYRITVNDELLSTSFTSKKKAIKYARSKGYAYSRK